MDSYYFLHTKSICIVDYNTYKSGLMMLNSLAQRLSSYEIKIKNKALYSNPLYVRLFSDYSETGVIIQFIEQCMSVEQDIENDKMFEELYPKQNVGFLGVDFNKILGVASQRQIVDLNSLQNCRNLYFERLIKEGQDKDLTLILAHRFPNFIFSKDALNDLLWWKHQNKIDEINTIIGLLDDVLTHPFSGGLGKTEVLTHTINPIVSKRINQKDRLTYTVGKKATIYRCKDHYQ